MNYLTLNRQANLIVELNYERAERVKLCIDACKARLSEQQRQQQQHPSHENADVFGGEYDALVAMGPSIIAHIMLEYSKDQTGPWFRLMHRLVYDQEVGGALTENGGAPFQDGVGDPQERYDAWKDWFEYESSSEATEERVPS